MRDAIRHNACRGPAHRALRPVRGEGVRPHVADRATKASPTDPTLLPWSTDWFRDRGPIVRNDDRNDPTTPLCPPLAITREECDEVVAVLADGFQEGGRRLGSIGSVHLAR